MTLPSGLPERVADPEHLPRFLTQSTRFTASAAKGSAFLPNPKSRNTSVFRLDGDAQTLRRTGEEAGLETIRLKGAAIVCAHEIRNAGLDVVASEPPPAHANIERWPWNDIDPRIQKAEQLKFANAIAAASRLVVF